MGQELAFERSCVHAAYLGPPPPPLQNKATVSDFVVVGLSVTLLLWTAYLDMRHFVCVPIAGTFSNVFNGLSVKDFQDTLANVCQSL